MTLPVIAAHSLLDDYTIVSDPAANADYPIARLSDDRTYRLCKMGSSETAWTLTIDAGDGNTIKCDYFSIVGHDLFNPSSDGLGACSVAFEQSADAAAWSDVVASFATTNNKIIFKVFTQIETRAFRVNITRGSGFIGNIGEIQFGERTEFPYHLEYEGYRPRERVIRGNNNFLVQGKLVGSTFNFTERMSSFTFKLIPDTFFTSTAKGDLGSILESHIYKLKPFIWAWNPDNSSLEQDAYFAILAADSRPDPRLATQLDVGFRDVTFSLQGEDDI